jgi:CMP-N-acetylneuraminic acid synthetase
VIRTSNILAVVPARGGSKGIPLKNLRMIGGVPMVALAGQVAQSVPEIDRAVVSTDHPEIVRAAEQSGLAAPFLRPPDLSGDRIGDWGVLHHALLQMEAIDRTQYDIVVMLQPTSPLRKAAHVSGTIHMLVEGGYDAVWSVSPTDSKAHPLKQLKIENGVMDYWDPAGQTIIARQQLQPVYHRNGVAYAITRDCLLQQGTIKGRRTGAYVVSGEQISIDTEWDIEMVEFFLNRRADSNQA